MKPIALALPILLAVGAPALAHGHDEDSTFSFCIAQRAGQPAEAQYFSDLFEGDADQYVEMSFKEYVDNSYAAAKKAGDYSVSCTTYPDHAKAEEALKAARASRADVPRRKAPDVATAWKTHFE